MSLLPTQDSPICPDESTLGKFLQDLLPGEDARRIDGHIGTCPACQRVLERLIAGLPSHWGRGAESVECGATETHDSAEAPDSDTAAPDAEPHDAGPAISSFGDYEILEELARGGMGIVYRARQVSLNRIVAIKRIRSGAFEGAEVERFHAEAEAAAHLDHHGIVPIYEVGEHGGQHYFSMAYVDGESLEARVKKGPLAPREAAGLMKQVAEAVGYAHARGVIHRDLKPANILVTPDGQTRVTDFGLAKKVADDPGLTFPGQLMGTPSYMAPEQAAGRSREIGPLSDIYALGATLYCLITGRPPFRGAGKLETLRQVLEEEPVPPGSRNPAVDLDIQTITLKCLEKRPERRYGSAHTLVAELDRYLRREPIHARPITREERALRWCRRKPAQAALLLLLLVLAVGGPITAWHLFRLNRAEAEQRQRAERSAFNARLGRVAHLIESSPADAHALLSDQTLLPRRYRDFTWRALRHRLDGKERVLTGHRDLVDGLAFSPESLRLASVDWTGTVKLWDVRTGKELRTVFQPDLDITRAELELSGRSGDQYDGRLRGGFLPVENPRFSACGRYLTVLWRPYRMHPRDRGDPSAYADSFAPLPRELWMFGLEGGTVSLLRGVYGYELSPTEPLLMFMGREGLSLHRLDEERTAQVGLPEGFGVVGDYAFDRAGRQILLASTKGGLARLDLSSAPPSFQAVGKLECAQTAALRFSPDGERVAVLDERVLPEEDEGAGTRVEWWLQVYDLRPALIAQDRVSMSSVRSMRWLSDGQQILVSSENETRLIRLREETLEQAPYPRLTRDPLQVVVLPRTGLLATALRDGARFDPFAVLDGTRADPEVRVRVANAEGVVSMTTRYPSEYDVDPARKVMYPRLNVINEGSLAASPDGRYLASANASWNIRLWDLARPDADWRSSGHSGRVILLRFSEDGSRVFSVGEDLNVVHRDVDTGAVLKRGQLPRGSERYLVELSGTGERAVVIPTRKHAEFDGDILDIKDCYVWDLPENRVVFEGKTLGVPMWPGWIRANVFPHLSHDGKLLFEAMSSYHQQPRHFVVWDIESAKVRWRLDTIGEPENSVPRPDGTVVTCSRDRRDVYLQYWDATDGRLLRTERLGSLLSKDDDPRVSLLGFAADGRFARLYHLDDRETWYDLEADRAYSGRHVTPDGRYVTFADSRKRTLRVVDVEGQAVTAVRVPSEHDFIDWSVDGQTMFLANADSTLSCWDAQTGQERATFPTGLHKITKMTVSPRGDAVALADEQGGIAVIRASRSDDPVD